MAIDPVTAKAIAQAAAKILTDKEARNKLLYLLLVILAVSLVVVLLPIYILTQPIEALKSVFADAPDDVAFVEQFKTENDEKVLTIGSDLIYEGVYPLPVKEANMTSKYGERIDPITGQTAFHYGTDFSGEWRSEIYAVDDGEVVSICTDKNDSFGNYIIIRHMGTHARESAGTGEFYALYGHMSEIYMYEGQTVKQGTVIGLMGGSPEEDSNPGRSTRTHLHFEIRKSKDSEGISPIGYIFTASETEDDSDE